MNQESANPQAKATQYTSIGGQAVIEGVMMRSPHFLSVAIRTSSDTILVKDERIRSLGDTFPILKKPFIRGIVSLIESMVTGIKILSFSAEVAAQNEKQQIETTNAEKKTSELSKLAISLSLITAFAAGMGLFVVAPHLITVGLGQLGLIANTTQSPVFHLVDGLIKVSFLLIYIYSISMMKDIFRVFQFHGAEHKSIANFESGSELTAKNASSFSKLHPRCGTSFLLFLLVISILVFSFLFPVIGASHLSANPILNHALQIILKIFLMLPVAGISYEFIKVSACNMDNTFLKALILPGLLLQKLTTKEPDEAQLEVALVSLKRVLFLEKNPQLFVAEPFTIRSSADVPTAQAALADFPE